MTILLVDDAPEMLGLWQRFLEPLNAEILTASNLADALELMKHVPPPDLVLLDLRLPDTDSKAETLNSIVKLKDLNPLCAVVAITGLLDEDTKRLGTIKADFIGDKRELASQAKLLDAVRAGMRKAGGDTNEHTNRCISIIESLASKGI